MSESYLTKQRDWDSYLNEQLTFPHHDFGENG